MKIKEPFNLKELSDAAFLFARRDKKWSFDDPAFEDVCVQEYSVEDFVRSMEDRLMFYRGEKVLFEGLEHFVAAVTILSFEDDLFCEEHLDELAKFDLEEIAVEGFQREWTEYSALLLKDSIGCPKGVFNAYSTVSDWNCVTIFGESSDCFYGMTWETDA